MKEQNEKKVEAYGTKGLDNTEWRRKFKNRKALSAWLEKMDGTLIGVREVSKYEKNEK